MAAHPSGKLPLPTLVVTAYTAKQPKKSRSLAEKIDAKRTKDKLRAKTRINIGSAHAPWRKLRDGLGLALDSQLARLLLDT
ncbi:unnamed protein product [Knipowitschia caucasica]|uniref:Uncharacterized protein n=1 Tax=Knipowitschia caucasica TaxID=637954 RepID=A0AAV2KI42_KNICA